MKNTKKGISSDEFKKLGVTVLCGALVDVEKPLVGSCGKWVNVTEVYRCADCTAPFHRKCLIRHFKYPMGKPPTKK